MWKSELQSSCPLLASVGTTMLGGRRCTKTPILAPVTHFFSFISDRAFQTGTLGCSGASGDRHECTKQAGGCVAVVLPLFSRYESPQRCTQGKNHYYLVSVAQKLKLATPLKWAACAPPRKNYFNIILRGIRVTIARGKTKSHGAVLSDVAAH